MNHPILMQNIILLGALLLGALATVLLRQIVKAAIALAFTSIVLTILMFRLGAPWAAVFELSVCAGLITVIFVGAISLVKPATEQEEKEQLVFLLRRYLPMLALLLVLGVWLSLLKPTAVPLPPPEAVAWDFRQLLWSVRPLDLLGQIMVMLAGVWGVVVLFKEK